MPNELKARFITRDGQQRRFDMGACRLRLDGQMIYHDVVFLDDEMPAQIGFVTLSEYALQCDPGCESRLVPMELRMPSLWRAETP